MAHSKGDMRVLHIAVLQTAGTIGVIAFHTGLRFTASGWIAVELFFVLAGFHMARSFDRYDTVASYTLSRVRRLAPEVSVVWGVAAACLAFGWYSPGLILFVCFAPLFLQNFIEPFFDSSAGINWIFLLALWFVAALLQLQVFLFALRRILVKSSTSTLICASLFFGLLFRLVFVHFDAGIHRDLSLAVADDLYRMPFTHIEAITFGFLLGRGRLQTIGRYFPAVLILMLGAGVANKLLAQEPIVISSLGFPVAMPLNYQYLWGYPLLALVATALCAPDCPLVVGLRRLNISSDLTYFMNRVGSLTYGAYVVHGLILSAYEMTFQMLNWPLNWRGQLLMFVLTTVGAFSAAWAFESLQKGGLGREAPIPPRVHCPLEQDASVTALTSRR